jgi:signal transduction histidine kinase
MRTLKQQLILVNSATIGMALLVALALMFTVEQNAAKDALVRDIVIKADIVGNQCTAALIFNAPKDAEETLHALRADPQIEYAAVYSRLGALFALYPGMLGRADAPPSPSPEGHRFMADHLELTRPIILHDEKLGSITIRTSLEQLRLLRVKYGIASAAILTLALLAASVLMARLQRSVTGPVTGLVQLMERVSRDKDYSRRAEISGPSELVSLAGSFNDMLTAIQKRDRELERSLRELQDAYRKLEELDQLKSDFISTVSHELRTPITSIKAFVEILMIKPHMPAERKLRILGNVSAESDRLSRLINDLLDLSRIESGVMSWRDQDVDIGEVIRSAMTGIRPLATKKGIRIEESIEGGQMTVQADRDRIMQVVMNLLSNAVKFTPLGGRISVAATRAASLKEIAVVVSDTGPGIPSGDLGRIFEKFQRSGDVLTNTVEGTGLGLAIARQIIEHYGGRIWAASDAGKGSAFTFTLPMAGWPAS